MTYTFKPIAYARTPYPQNFGIPRQSGLVANAHAYIKFEPFITADCLRGLEQFSHVWVQFIFHHHLEEGWNPLVRPPRLGGRQKMGVLATRSPHRPNPIGLSLMKIEAFHHHPLTLVCSGADLLNETPIIDIKPYLPFLEAQPQAKSGFASSMPLIKPVSWSIQAQKMAAALALDDFFLGLIEDTLAQDPKPAFHHYSDRKYFIRINGHEICFSSTEKNIEIINIRNLSLDMGQ